MLEYVIAVCAMLAAIAALGWVVTAAKRSASRTAALVASDCP